MTLSEQLELDEGFRPKPYQCTEGVWTFGHGFTYLTIEESRTVLRLKIDKLRADLHHDIKHLSPARQDVIINMAYNLGLGGLFGFKMMWAALYRGDYDTAADEMLNSRWARQVKGRAVRLADEMRKG